MKKSTKIETIADETALPTNILENNVALLVYLKEHAFQGDHPGIDKMVGEMKKELQARKFKWVSWCCKRAGNDGRRPSGVVWQRTKCNHAVLKGGLKTLCNREVGCLEEGKFTELPRCKTCLKRMERGTK